MKVKIIIDDANELSEQLKDEDKRSQFLMRIYKAFPNAIWEREGKGFLVFI